jgi:hypothetical protein
VLVLVGIRQSAQFCLKEMSESHHRDELEVVTSEIVDVSPTDRPFEQPVPPLAAAVITNPSVVPVQIAQHEHEGTELPVKIEGLVTITRLNHVETTTLADCGNDLAQRMPLNCWEQIAISLVTKVIYRDGRSAFIVWHWPNSIGNGCADGLEK